jgi:hypothetical protein
MSVLNLCFDMAKTWLVTNELRRKIKFINRCLRYKFCGLEPFQIKSSGSYLAISTERPIVRLQTKTMEFSLGSYLAKQI